MPKGTMMTIEVINLERDEESRVRINSVDLLMWERTGGGRGQGMHGPGVRRSVAEFQSGASMDDLYSVVHVAMRRQSLTPPGADVLPPLGEFEQRFAVIEIQPQQLATEAAQAAEAAMREAEQQLDGRPAESALATTNGHAPAGEPTGGDDSDDPSRSALSAS